MRLRKPCAPALLLLAVLFALPLQAQPVTHSIGLQGLLLDSDGETLAGTFDLTFRLFGTANGGGALWTETHAGVPVNDGLYEVALGENQDLPSDLFTAAPRYLEVSVDGEVLNPRIPLRSVPLANTARTLADGALQAGTNVSITRQAGGILRIDASGGGGTGGLSSVATDATIVGDGTSGNPIGLSDGAVTEDKLGSAAVTGSKIADSAVTGSSIADGALQAGSNVTITRQGDGALEISASGSGGGLTSVTSDATLSGNGTSGSPLGLSNGAVTESKLAGGAVTGSKIADGALQAGSNVTITRQGNGALEIGATGGGGFSLPFSGSTSSGSAVFTVANTGSGDGLNISSGKFGIRVTQAGDHGLLVDQANDGVNVVSVSGSGVAVGAAGNDGVFVQSAGRFGLNVVNAVRGVDINTTTDDGVLVRNAGQHGIEIQNAGSKGIQLGNAGNNGIQIDQAGHNGIQINQVTNFDGVHIQSAGRDGLHVGQASDDGLHISQAAEDGILVQSAGRYGVLIEDAMSNGVQIEQASTGVQIEQAVFNGIQVGTTGFDGIQIQDPGRDGIRVSNAGGLAGNFGGDVDVTGTLSKGGGSFKIDHPLDPANKYLRHSFVESPDMINVYNGNAVLGAGGQVVVELPEYFEALNRDFRYQLTAIGAPGPNLHIAERISGNRFRIAGGTPGMEVSWQVTGIRQDAWANENRIVVEEAKPAEERGYYMHPKLHGQPETLNVLHSDPPNEF